uniref:Spermatogenesis associated 1 n=1 Tax=Sus scrofa TaxID=9823 RepID=A0A4X1V1B2_PIG
MKKDKKVCKISTSNYPLQTLGNMSLNSSRPSSSELVELHVFYVPEGSWNYELNTISREVINKFISAGFIRVSPHLTLQALREHLGEFLGEDAVAEKFLFLKCIGNNLSVVKTKQESELKLKSFAPPYALQPELYLLPIMDHLGNIYSASSTVSLDGHQINNGVTEADGIIHSITLSKEEPGTDPSFLENTLKELLNKNQKEGDFNWNGKDKEVVWYILVVKSVSKFWANLALQIDSIKGKLKFILGIFKNGFSSWEKKRQFKYCAKKKIKIQYL